VFGYDRLLRRNALPLLAGMRTTNFPASATAIGAVVPLVANHLSASGITLGIILYVLPIVACSTLLHSRLPELTVRNGVDLPTWSIDSSYAWKIKSVDPPQSLEKGIRVTGEWYQKTFGHGMGQ
jgi:hypothetical protein